MKMLPPKPIDPRQLAEILISLKAGSELNQVIRQMRAFGWNKIECIKTLREHAGIPLGKAKDIVHLSPAWADCYESDEALHDVVEQALQIFMKEERSAA